MKLENENIIQKFLLGEMAEEERSQFEERFITDAELFEEIKVVEDELIERYVRGRMDPAEGASFEKSFLTTAKRRERVENSRYVIEGLIHRKDNPAVESISEETNSEHSIWEKFTAFFLTPQFAAGLAALALALVGWIVYQNLNRENPEVVQEGNTNVVETPTPAPANIETNEVNSAVPEDMQVNKSIPIKKPTPKVRPTKTPSPAKTPVIVKSAPNPVLALFPGTLRSGGKTGQVSLPKGAKNLQLRLNLARSDYKTYVVEIVDADGAAILESGKLKPGKSSISISVPVKKLKRGDYLVKLRGFNGEGASESVADYQFRINE